jgi:hypothetical protein
VLEGSLARVEINLRPKLLELVHKDLLERKRLGKL